MDRAEGKDGAHRRATSKVSCLSMHSGKDYSNEEQEKSTKGLGRCLSVSGCYYGYLFYMARRSYVLIVHREKRRIGRAQ